MIAELSGSHSKLLTYKILNVQLKEFNKGYSKKYFREELPTDCFFIKVLLQNSSSSSSIKYGVLSTD